MLLKLKREYTSVQTAEYGRDLNASTNIAHRVMSSMGWGD